MTKRQNKGEAQPRVGIFWWFNGELISDSTSLSRAEPYGDALTHPTAHIDHWSLLQQRGVIPAHLEYDEPPRGRVGYDKQREQFFFYADRCIIKSSAAVRAVIDILHLPEDTRPQPDAHYRCTKCLGRQRERLGCG